jgi:hypothetical protein
MARVTPAQLKKIYGGRITEDYLLSQLQVTIYSDNFNDHKDRIDKTTELYQGHYNMVYPDGQADDEILVENRIKTDIHDISRLANEPKASLTFVSRGSKKDDAKESEIRASIAATIWDMNRGDTFTRQLFMDLIGSGFMVAPLYYNSQSEYAQFTRLDPRFCYPQVRNGKLQNLVYGERVFSRVAASMEEKFPAIPPEATDEIDLINYYDEHEVVKAAVFMIRQPQQGVGRNAVQPPDERSLVIYDRWVHNLGCVPVAFEKLDTYDNAFHGMFEQVGRSVIARNAIVKYMVESAESRVHAPFEEKNILNPDALPGPNTVYHHDPNSQDSFMRRVQAEDASNQIFPLLGILGQEERQETGVPASRAGVVPQSIASGSFVTTTQGQLTSVVQEIQDKMANLRYHITYVSFKIEEKFLNFEKPLVRAIGRKKMYLPSKDIDGWYAHKVTYGVAAGLDKQTADVRLLQYKSAGAISDQTMREQIDFIPDPTSEQDKIDRETVQRALVQKWVSDPATPPVLLMEVTVAMNNGMDFADAVKSVMEHAQQLAQQQQANAAGANAQPGPNAEPGQIVPPQSPTTGPDQGVAAGGTEVPLSGAGGETKFAPPPMQQIITRN